AGERGRNGDHPGPSRPPAGIGAGCHRASAGQERGRPAGWRDAAGQELAGVARGVPVTLDILEVGARGDGVAELDGQRYFVAFTLPGETVKAESLDKRGEGIAAKLIEVLAPSRHRETPPCAHFMVCGGCALQHWRRDAYTAWKVGLLTRALTQR